METIIFRMTKPSQYAGAIACKKLQKCHLALAWPKSPLNLAILTGDRACSVSFVESVIGNSFVWQADHFFQVPNV